MHKYAAATALAITLITMRTLRFSAIAIVAALAVAVSGPALAQKSKKRTSAATIEMNEQCESQAIAQGLTRGQAGHTEYVRQCVSKWPASLSCRPPVHYQLARHCWSLLGVRPK
jgi:hypothetical protein